MEWRELTITEESGEEDGGIRTRGGEEIGLGLAAVADEAVGDELSILKKIT